MPGLNISVGNREFEVACDPGEEDFLTAAAALLDEQAQVFVGQGVRMPESQLLLMSGLLLADKVTEAQDKITELTAELERLKSAPAQQAAVPEDLISRLQNYFQIFQIINLTIKK